MNQRVFAVFLVLALLLGALAGRRQDGEYTLEEIGEEDPPALLRLTRKPRFLDRICRNMI